MRYALIPTAISAALLLFGLAACGDREADTKASDSAQLERCVEDALGDFENESGELLEELEREHGEAKEALEREIDREVGELEAANQAIMDAVEVDLDGHVNLLSALIDQSDDPQTIDALERAVESLRSDAERFEDTLAKELEGALKSLRQKESGLDDEFKKSVDELVRDFVGDRCAECSDDKGDGEYDKGEYDKGDEDWDDKDGWDDKDDDDKDGWDDKDDECKDDLGEDPCDWDYDDDDEK